MDSGPVLELHIPLTVPYNLHDKPPIPHERHDCKLSLLCIIRTDIVLWSCSVEWLDKQFSDIKGWSCVAERQAEALILFLPDYPLEMSLSKICTFCMANQIPKESQLAA